MEPAWEWPALDYWQHASGLHGLAFGKVSCTPNFPLGPPLFAWNLTNKEELALTLTSGVHPLDLD